MKKFYLASLLFYFFAFNGNGGFAHATPNNWSYQKVQGYKFCAKCHENQVEIWKKTKHFKGYKKLTKHKNAKKIAISMGVNPKKIKKSTICASCHFTLGHKKSRPSPISGVSCESCHGPSKDWLGIHNDFGGKEVKKRKFESPVHRAERHQKQTSLGMIFPENIYRVAKNCYRCHLVTNEKLLNVTIHSVPDSFDLAQRTQGKLRHGPKASISQIRKMKILGYAVELELSLAELAKTKASRYADAMINRAATALANLDALQKTVNNAGLNTIVNLAKLTGITVNNTELSEVSRKISAEAEKLSKESSGDALAGAENHTHIKLAKADLAKYMKSETSLPEKISKQPSPSKKPKPAESSTISEKNNHETQPRPEIKQPITKPSINPVVAIAKPLPGQIKETKNVDLIANFEVLVPTINRLCQTNNPWMLGIKVLNNGGSMSSQDCFALRLKTNKTSQIYFFSQSENGKSFRLFPNDCNALGDVSNKVKQAGTLALPQNKSRKMLAIGLDNETGVEWLHAVAIDSAEAKKALEDSISAIPDVCDTSVNTKYSADLLQQAFTTVGKKHRENFDWKTVKFIHK